MKHWIKPRNTDLFILYSVNSDYALTYGRCLNFIIETAFILRLVSSFNFFHYVQEYAHVAVVILCPVILWSQKDLLLLSLIMHTGVFVI